MCIKMEAHEEILSSEVLSKLEAQNSRIVGESRANKLEKDTQRNWDIFYKRLLYLKSL